LLHRTLNLGILAHVDAGKTTLTERLLYETGVIAELGSVDAGTTQTDTLALERERGITIRSAVASFALGDLRVNLIDTPGHPDFIAEVERVLRVLDGAVLVVSAVEGVQPQTRILYRALARLRIPTLFFVNKTDRTGADPRRVIGEIRDRLTTNVVPMDDAPEALAELDETVLAAYLEDGVSAALVRTTLAADSELHPAYAGSAITGEGVPALMDGIAAFLPDADADTETAPYGSVFKIERAPNGEKIAYARLFSGTVRVRDSLRVGREAEEKVTRIESFDGSDELAAGGVARLWGLREAQVGDRLGEPGIDEVHKDFPPPTLESVLVTRDEDRERLRVALDQLAEQDPLIDVRQDDQRHELSVSLYGDVQKEVIQATLANEYDLDVEFRETTPIYVERPVYTREAVEAMHTESNPHLATIGLRIAPALEGAGVVFSLDVSTLTIPLYIYKTREQFAEHMAEYVRDALRTGLYGWQVTDCVVTMTQCVYAIPDGPPSRRGRSTAADFRKLTPLVVREALKAAGTVVCEPVVRARLEAPAATIGALLAAVGRLAGTVEAPSVTGDLATVETTIAATRAQDLLRELPGLTHGEGVLESEFAGHRAVHGPPYPFRRIP
jgi:ribosomal protection tetracycline resistance protein